MNYYIYYVGGQEAREYLNGTNYVGVWENNEIDAFNKVKSYFKENTTIVSVSKEQVRGLIGYLY
ncbi:hypothetical protein ACOMCU_01610 [Lysinibacillus sp. UGB7]|uniref:hypothetical protein n=1 Tax=Lysinibacillus sp. UGB7 TaxID=3411039 RepID=UPI003B7E442D